MLKFLDHDGLCWVSRTQRGATANALLMIALTRLIHVLTLPISRFEWQLVCSSSTLFENYPPDAGSLPLLL
jgi:hypothetical protein